MSNVYERDEKTERWEGPLRIVYMTVVVLLAIVGAASLLDALTVSPTAAGPLFLVTLMTVGWYTESCNRRDRLRRARARDEIDARIDALLAHESELRAELRAELGQEKERRIQLGQEKNRLAQIAQARGRRTQRDR